MCFFLLLYPLFIIKHTPSLPHKPLCNVTLNQDKQHIIIIIIIIIIPTFFIVLCLSHVFFMCVAIFFPHKVIFNASQVFFFLNLYRLMIDKLLQDIHFSMQMKNTPGGMDLSQLKWKCRNKQEAEK